MVDHRFHLVKYVFLGWQNHSRYFGPIRTFWHTVKSLLDNANGLTHLLHSEQVTIISITVLTGDNIEVEILITPVGCIAAQIALDPTSAQHRPGQRPVDGIFCRYLSHVLGAIDKYLVSAQEHLIVPQPLRDELDGTSR